MMNEQRAKSPPPNGEMYGDEHFLEECDWASEIKVNCFCYYFPLWLVTLTLTYSYKKLDINTSLKPFICRL